MSSRVWVDFPALQLCWAVADLPARFYERISLLDVAACKCRERAGDPGLRVDIYGQVTGLEADLTVGGGALPTVGGGSLDSSPSSPAALSLGAEPRGVLVAAEQFGPALTVASVSSGVGALREFAEALVQLLASRDSEGSRGLEFIQKRLFQYLWRHQGMALTEEAMYEAQAVLVFNLAPREGVAYMRSKLGKVTDTEVGAWLAQMSIIKGGLDPTMLGAYFSRRDTMEVFKAFVRCLEFSRSDIVTALRVLFDTFKPGGEGQVITRILELFAEAYFLQWADNKESIQPNTAYRDSDSVLQLAVSLIMLNTGLHLAAKKCAGKKVSGAEMTVEEYIQNTRRAVGPEEVPELALRRWYEAVRQVEISVEPLPRVAFTRLPVPPTIEGWLVAVLDGQVHRRYWAVLALQRLYLFSDTSEVEPSDAIDLKDATARAVNGDKACQERFNADVRSSRSKCKCFAWAGRADPFDAEHRAFEVCLPSSHRTFLEKVSKPRTRLAFVAESADLMEKWVSLISAGPY